MHLLVTGAAGFIGSNFVRFWLERHPADSILAVDLLTYAGNASNLEGLGGVRLVQTDIADFEAMRELMDSEHPDAVVNFAAESHNSYAVLNPTVFFRTNVLGTQSLLESARLVGVRRFHHISTCEVYGELDLDSDERFTEESPYRP